MKGAAIILLLALAGSATANVVLVQRLKTTRNPVTGPAPAPAPRAAGGLVPAPATMNGSTDRSDQILAELSNLRAEVADLRGRLGGGAPSLVSGDSPRGEPTVVRTTNPRLAGILAEQEKLSSFWKDLGKVTRARKSLKPEEFRQSMIDLAADFLGLQGGSRSNFQQAALNAATEVERAMKEYTEGMSQVKYDQKNPKAYHEACTTLWTRYSEGQKAANDMLVAAIPQDHPHQKGFAASVGRFTGAFGLGGSHMVTYSMTDGGMDLPVPWDGHDD